MIRYDDSIDAEFDSAACLIRVQNAFEQQWPVPQLPQPLHVFPGKSRIQQAAHAGSERHDVRSASELGVVGEGESWRACHAQKPSRMQRHVEQIVCPQLQRHCKAVAHIPSRQPGTWLSMVSTSAL
jgi:hypothetical protein